MQITLSLYWTRYLEEMVEFEGFTSPNDALRHILTAYQESRIVQGIRDEARRTEDTTYVEQLPAWNERTMDDLVARAVVRVRADNTSSIRRPPPWHLLPSLSDSGN